MKILLLNSLYYPNLQGGAERSVQYLAEALVDIGCEVVVVSLGRKKEVTTHNRVKLYYLDLANIYWPFGQRRGTASRLLWNVIDVYNPVMARRVGSIIERENPDVVHTNNVLGFSPAIWKIAKNHNIKVVHTVRDHYLLCPRSTMFRNGRNCQPQCLSCALFSWTKRYMGKYVDHVVGISGYMLKRHIDSGWFSRCSGSVIYNSYDAQSSYQPAHGSQTIRYGFIGRLGDYKGIELLCDTFLQLPDRINAKLVVAGTGERSYVEKLKKRVKGSPVKFLGFVAPEEFYGQVDIVIVPSLCNEALGRTIIEAYAHGLPVIVARRGGMPEIVKEGRTGLLFDPDKPDELLKCMKEVAHDASILSLPNLKCFAFADRFSTDQIARQYLEIYESVCKINQKR